MPASRSLRRSRQVDATRAHTHRCSPPSTQEQPHVRAPICSVLAMCASRVEGEGCPRGTRRRRRRRPAIHDHVKPSQAAAAGAQVANSSLSNKMLAQGETGDGAMCASSIGGVTLMLRPCPRRWYWRCSRPFVHGHAHAHARVGSCVHAVPPPSGRLERVLFLACS